MAEQSMAKTQCLNQTSVNRGPDSTFVDEVSSTRSSPKRSRSQVLKLLDGTLVTRPRGESRVTSTFIRPSLVQTQW